MRGLSAALSCTATLLLALGWHSCCTATLLLALGWHSLTASDRTHP